MHWGFSVTGASARFILFVGSRLHLRLLKIRTLLIRRCYQLVNCQAVSGCDDARFLPIGLKNVAFWGLEWGWCAPDLLCPSLHRPCHCVAFHLL